MTMKKIFASMMLVIFCLALNVGSTAADSQMYSLRLYDALDDEDQAVYNDLYACMMNRTSYEYEYRAELGGKYEETQYITEMTNFVLYDHPEIFWVTGADKLAFYNDRKHVVMFDFCCDEEEIKAVQNQLNQLKQDFSEAKRLNSAEKVNWALDYVVDHISYDDKLEETSDDTKSESLERTGVGALLNGKSVCSGYAKSLQLILHELDVPCGYMTGTFKSTGVYHAWNIVSVNGSTYCIDPTFVDSGSDAYRQITLNVISTYRDTELHSLYFMKKVRS